MEQLHCNLEKNNNNSRFVVSQSCGGQKHGGPGLNWQLSVLSLDVFTQSKSFLEREFPQLVPCFILVNWDMLTDHRHPNKEEQYKLD